MTEQNGNGTHQIAGRAVPEAPTYTFANGVVARLNPVSQFTIAHVEIQARKKFPPPEPPLNEVDYGDGNKKFEPNYSDPRYEAEMARYTTFISMKAFDAIMELGIDVEVDTVALGRIQRTMDLIGTPLEEISDKVAYIKHCCIRDLEHGMTELQVAMRSLMGPREEDVADHIATFPRVVSGP